MTSQRNDAGFTLLELLLTSGVVLVTLGIVSQIIVQSGSAYRAQEARLEARQQAASALDMIGRLVRQARTITPDPDGNGIMDSIQIVADWNPRDGDNNDPYETITFTNSNGVILKREPTDAAPVPFADRVVSMRFAYRTPAGVTLINPTTVSPTQLGYITIVLQGVPVAGQAGTTYTTSVSVRRTE
jgi:type II secretory pathway pseudopilin PulG